MKVKEKSEKIGLKLNIQKTKMMASHHFMANRGGKSGGSEWLQPWIRKQLLLGRNTTTNLDSLLKRRNIILLTKVWRVKTMIFPVVTYGCESWTIKKTEHLRISAFKLWCWRRLLRVPWTARRSNQSVLKEISPEYSLEGLMLKLQYFGHQMWRASSLEKTLMLTKIGGRRRRGDRGRDSWMASLTQGTWIWENSRS